MFQCDQDSQISSGWHLVPGVTPKGLPLSSLSYLFSLDSTVCHSPTAANLHYTVTQFPIHSCLFSVSEHGMADCYEIKPLPGSCSRAKSPSQKDISAGHTGLPISSGMAWPLFSGRLLALEEFPTA